jgi:hypothetical protein
MLDINNAALDRLLDAGVCGPVRFSNANAKSQPATLADILVAKFFFLSDCSCVPTSSCAAERRLPVLLVSDASRSRCYATSLPQAPARALAQIFFRPTPPPQPWFPSAATTSYISLSLFQLTTENPTMKSIVCSSVGSLRPSQEQRARRGS